MLLFQQFIEALASREGLQAATLAGFVLCLIYILSSLVIRVVRRAVSESKTDIDDFFLNTFRSSRFALAILAAAYVGLRYLPLPQEGDIVAGRLFTLFIFLAAGYWCSKILTFIINRQVDAKLETSSAKATTLSIVGFIAKTVLWTIVVLLILDNFGVDITALVAGMGISGIAVALAAQNILGDLFASVAIALDKPFAIGDYIVVGEFKGNVERIGLKTTRIRSISGELLIFGNTDLIASRIRNFKKMEERRIVFQFGLIYQTSPELLKKVPGIVEEIITAAPNARFDRAHFLSFGASSLDFEVVYFMLVPDYNEYVKTQHAINMALFETFAEKQLEFAYPTQTLFLDKAEQRI